MPTTSPPLDPMPIPSVPVVDVKTGKMDQNWYDFFKRLEQVVKKIRTQAPTVAPTYGATVTVDATTGDTFIITATNGTAFTIAAPLTPTNGQVATFTIRNASGGALGAITWNAVFKMPAFTSPANGNSRSVTFHFDGTNWVQRYQSAADVPN